MSAFPAHPAWDFVVRLYGQPEVAQACLELQERHGIDVTMMLFCLWRGSIDGQPLGARIAPLAQAARTWHMSAVVPMRAARRWLKEEAKRLDDRTETSLFKTVLSAEIDCEHGELLMVARLAESLCNTPDAGSPQAMAENLATFFKETGISLAEGDRAAIAAILSGAGAAEEIRRVLPVA